jgi:hypothetical protein
MSTVAQIITSARYDIRDEDATQYSDDMLLDFINRGVSVLCSGLASLSSDWVNSTSNISLSPAISVKALPTYFISDISCRIGTHYLSKKSVSEIRDMLVTSTAGEPQYYAIKGTELIFDRVTDTSYTLILEYNAKNATLTLASVMPFNDEFNDVLRQFIILCAKSRNEFIVVSDAAMQDFFYDNVFAKLIARNYVLNLHRTLF